MPQIIDELHAMIEANQKIQILKISPVQEQAYYQYLVEYFLNPPPIEKIKGKMQFLGRKIEVI